VSPVLVGYMAKRTARAGPEHKLPPHVREIASVSGCISSGPPKWIERWIHNDLGFFDSPELALSVVPEEERRLYDVYAYKVLPLLFDPPRELEWTPPAPEVRSLPSDFQRLGWDVAGRTSRFFDCSPLSCNSMGAEVRVNERCLFHEAEDAVAFIRSEKILGCEPGPYAVVEVWRQRP
jgi:hypothetical protein